MISNVLQKCTDHTFSKFIIKNILVRRAVDGLIQDIATGIVNQSKCKEQFTHRKMSPSNVDFEPLWWGEYNAGRRARAELLRVATLGIMITQLLVCDPGLSAWLAPIIKALPPCPPPTPPPPHTHTHTLLYKTPDKLLWVMAGGEMDGWGGILQRVGQDDKGRGERKTEICCPHTSHSGPDRWVKDTRRHMHVWLRTLKRRSFHSSWLHNISSSLNSKSSQARTAAGKVYLNIITQ